MSKEAMKLALEALEVDPFEMVEDANGHMVFLTNQAITALREALAEQPAQPHEPVAWKHDCAALLTNDVELWIPHCPHCGKPRTSPPAQRKPLTDEQIVAKALHLSGLGTSPDVIQFARAIEAAHGIKEKNT